MIKKLSCQVNPLPSFEKKVGSEEILNATGVNSILVTDLEIYDALQESLIVGAVQVQETTIGDRSMSAFKMEIASGRPRNVFIRFKVFDIKAIHGAQVKLLNIGNVISGNTAGV